MDLVTMLGVCAKGYEASVLGLILVTSLGRPDVAINATEGVTTTLPGGKAEVADWLHHGHEVHVGLAGERIHALTDYDPSPCVQVARASTWLAQGGSMRTWLGNKSAAKAAARLARSKRGRAHKLKLAEKRYGSRPSLEPGESNPKAFGSDDDFGGEQDFEQGKLTVAWRRKRYTATGPVARVRITLRPVDRK